MMREKLVGRVDGWVVGPEDPEWDKARGVYNLAGEQHPRAIVGVTGVSDVITAIEVAAECGVPVAAQRTGHGAFGSLDGSLLLKTDALNEVVIDAERRVARIGAGALWSDIVTPAAKAGLVGLHGTAKTVCATGYSLGGGVGWYARRFGLATNSVVAVELVGADGRPRRVDAEHDPELFWALRGGGGNFGIVTALEMRLHPVDELHAGTLFFDLERASEVVHRWHEWTATAPDEVTSIVRIMRFPPFPGVPHGLSGREVVAIEAVAIDGAQDAVRPLRALGPEVDSFGPCSPLAVPELHLDPEHPVLAVGGYQLLRGLDAAAVDAFVAAVGPGSGSRLWAQIRHLGGALARAEAGHGALGTLDGAYMTFAVGLVTDEESRRSRTAEVNRLEAALAPWDSGRRYLNFTAERTDPARFYTPEAYRRLRAVKAAVDPDGLIRADHPITPALGGER